MKFQPEKYVIEDVPITPFIDAGRFHCPFGENSLWKFQCRVLSINIVRPMPY